jgi:hypothetical protein
MNRKYFARNRSGSHGNESVEPGRNSVRIYSRMSYSATPFALSAAW